MSLLNSSIRTSSAISDPLDLSSIMESGVEIPNLTKWRFFPFLTPARILRAYESVRLHIPDSQSWLDFSIRMNKATYFESEHGWIFIENIVPGASAELHGASFDGRGGSSTEYSEMSKLLDLVMNEYKLLTLISLPPSHAHSARIFVHKMGFVDCGVIPCVDTWQGIPRNLEISYRVRSKEASS